ncbi:hypothetical protein GCM10010347_59470 [Streptomyces cirratus]|uniref:Uncharacterized protein n=1 Tax=Streptomyces cirratus TaxID=68187 RepID=A0ABQ3F438_9ACTN|nr:hypothetical protein [Streptomyces cirratus]GHB80793.1 hypothetical protein GCM10010347_59470 [Streptomyces cirratus]
MDLAGGLTFAQPGADVGGEGIDVLFVVGPGELTGAPAELGKSRTPQGVEKRVGSAWSPWPPRPAVPEGDMVHAELRDVGLSQ